MSEQIPRAVVSGRRVAMTMLVIAMLITTLAVLWLISLWVTQPIPV